MFLFYSFSLFNQWFHFSFLLLLYLNLCHGMKLTILYWHILVYLVLFHLGLVHQYTIYSWIMKKVNLYTISYFNLTSLEYGLLRQLVLQQHYMFQLYHTILQFKLHFYYFTLYFQLNHSMMWSWLQVHLLEFWVLLHWL